MDYSTWHDQKPTHPAVDPELALLRLQADEAWDAYNQAADQRFRDMLDGGEVDDLSHLLDAAIAASARAKACYERLNAEPPDRVQMTTSNPGYRKGK